MANAAIEHEVQEELLNLTTGENNVVQKLSDEGNTQSLVQMIGTITDTLNTEEQHSHKKPQTQKILNERKEVSHLAFALVKCTKV